MTTPLEIAEREAAEAEAEFPDSEEAAEAADNEPPAEPEPEPEAEKSSLTVIEDLDKKLRSEATRHENALAKLHPDDWDSFAMCPLCIGDGFLQPIGQGEMPDQIWEAVTVLAGRAQTGELRSAPFSELCDVCGGLGIVDTHAGAAAMPTPTCRNCAGYGWLDLDSPAPGYPPAPNAKKNPPASQALAAVPEPVAATVTPWPDYDVPFVPFPGGQADPYNRPAGHPRWGLPTTADGRQL